MAISLLVGLVLMAELFNTAIEAVLDGLHPGEGDFVRKAKDCAAAAVLVASTAAVLGGLAMLFDVLPGRLA
jgi:diacylglycerol kinase (ATP)